MPDRRQRVGHDRQPGDAAGEGALRVVVVQRHLQALVGVLVVHVVDDVQRVDVDVGQPGHGVVEALPDVVEVQRVAGDRLARGRMTSSPETSSRPPLMAYSRVLARFTRAPKNCIRLPTGMLDTQQAIAQSSPPSLNSRSRSSDSYWMAEVSIETFAQNSLKPCGQRRRPEHGQVRLGSRAEVVEGLQEAEATSG